MLGIFGAQFRGRFSSLFSHIARMKIAELEQFSPLVRDYVSNFQSSSLKDFFALAPAERGPKLATLIEKKASNWNADLAKRETIATLLREQHASNQTLSAAVKANLELIGAENTLAIVTGQQVALFGGPLYSLYKTASTITLANQLKALYPKFNFVPIFWLETEDHDLEEASSVTVLDANLDLKTIVYEPAQLKAARDGATSGMKSWRKQIGPLVIEEAAMTQVFAELEAALTPTEFTPGLITSLKACYLPGRTFAQAYASVLHIFFGDDGLLVLDANNRTTKSLGAPLFQKELQTSPQLSEQIILDSVHMEEHYHAQIKPRALNLFLIEQGERYPIDEKERATNGERSFFLQGTRKYVSLADLEQILATEPERFSPNVVMRPLYQDTLLPTVAYVGGPGEIAYFAQLRSAYKWAGIEMPLVVPRISAMLVEDRFDKIFEKYGLTISDMLRGGRNYVTQFLESLADPLLAPKFEEANKLIQSTLEGLRESVVKTEATLDDSLSTLKGKMNTQLRDFLGKTLAADRKHHAMLKAKLERLLAALLPREGLQERGLSPIYFANKYGDIFWKNLKQELIEKPHAMDEFQIIRVSGTPS
jgi:bacillithiol biosynthesis cysteine-adding enzyme BshC